MLAKWLLAAVLWTAKQWDAWLLVVLAGADSGVVVAAGPLEMDPSLRRLVS